MTCEKCGSPNINMRYIDERQIINSSSFRKVENEFITSNEYDCFYQLTAKKNIYISIVKIAGTIGAGTAIYRQLMEENLEEKSEEWRG